MKFFRCFLVFCFLFVSSYAIGQNSNDVFSKIKHIEIVSEIQDTMALINKDDINKINKVFYERNYLDSLRVVDSMLIDNGVQLKEKMDSIVKTQINIIANQGIIIKQYKDAINENQTDISELEKQHKKDKNSKIAWQSVSGTLAAVLLIVLLI